MAMRYRSEGLALTIAREILTEGGAGSGNFGHAGRPGEVGGSAPPGAGGPHETQALSAAMWAGVPRGGMRRIDAPVRIREGRTLKNVVVGLDRDKNAYIRGEYVERRGREGRVRHFPVGHLSAIKARQEAGAVGIRVGDPRDLRPVEAAKHAIALERGEFNRRVGKGGSAEAARKRELGAVRKDPEQREPEAVKKSPEQRELFKLKTAEREARAAAEQADAEKKGKTDLSTSPLSKDKDAMKLIKGKRNITEAYIVKLENGAKGVWKPRQGMVGEFEVGNEVAAHDLAKAVGMGHIVPETVHRELEGTKGSLQRFFPGKVHADMPEGEKWGKSPMDVARAGAFDILIANTDRHQGNFMINKAGQLALIDHGFTLGSREGFGQELIVSSSHTLLLNRAARQDPDLLKEVQAEWKGKWPAIEAVLTARKFPEAGMRDVKGRYDEIMRVKGFKDLGRAHVRRFDEGRGL